ncbi:MAG: TolC family protein [bacterium]|nr:TolC family protein [bacterium]
MTPEEYRQSADKEVYALLDERRMQLFAEPAGFNIDPPQGSLRQRILRGEWTADEPLSLVECLQIAAENNRSYQSTKEGLYRVALDVTLERWDFQNRGFASILGSSSGTFDDAGRAGVDSTGGVTRLLGSGATIMADIGLDLFRGLATGDGWDAIGDLGLSITQPLLRGAGELITKENLTQAERDLVYEVRDFERFRRTFAVDVAGEVYNLLQSINELENEEQNYENLVKLRERNQALVEAGRLSDIEADQAEQDELRSQNRLIGLRGSLENQRDAFNLFLGLPIGTEVSLDPDEFERLSSEEELLDRIDQERAVDFALGSRLDFLTTLDTLEDAERQVLIAEDALRAGLSLSASVDSASREGRPTDFRSDFSSWSTSLNLDLPIDRVAERNAYRRSLIAFQAAERSTEERADSIQADVRQAIRAARNTRDSYIIQVGAEQLAQRRVESASLNLQAGRASTRDVLEAQEALVDAQNTKTSALIDFTLARLELFLQLEVLRVDDGGIQTDAELLQRLIED